MRRGIQNVQHPQQGASSQRPREFLVPAHPEDVRTQTRPETFPEQLSQITVHRPRDFSNVPRPAGVISWQTLQGES